jgi:ABC-type lipoprotein export system ATPase subunit
VLLADEPTGALDTKTGKEIMKLLLELHAERGTSIVLVTHDPTVAEYAHRQIFMRDGRVVDQKEAQAGAPN